MYWLQPNPTPHTPVSNFEETPSTMDQATHVLNTWGKPCSYEDKLKDQDKNFKKVATNKMPIYIGLKSIYIIDQM